jgi:hypothetical protein
MDGDGYSPRQVAWDADKDAVLREMWPTHVATEISRTMYRLWPAYNWSKNVVIGRARRINLEFKKTAASCGPRKKRLAPSPPPPILRDPRTAAFDFSAPEEEEPPIKHLRVVPRARRYAGEVVEPSIGTATILGVGTKQCRFPMWRHDETGAPDFPLCGAEVRPGSSYCAPHHARCWTTPRKKPPTLFLIGDSRGSLLGMQREREREDA